MKQLLLLIILSISLGSTGYAQQIQNTFCKMRLGSVISTGTILYNVGSRATFSDEIDKGNYTRVIFEDASFGGETWDLMEFQLTPQGRFFRFYVASYYRSDEIGLSKFDFQKVKDRLINKYPKAKITEKRDGYEVYIKGDNDDSSIRVMLRLHPLKPILSLDYYNKYLLDKVKEAKYDDL